MNEPYGTTYIAPLRDAGTIEFATENLDAYPRLHDAIRDHADGSGKEEPPDGAAFKFDDYRQLLRLLCRLQKRLLKEEIAAVRCRLKYGATEGTDWHPLSSLFETVGGCGVTEYVLHEYFTTYLQPIVQPNGQVMGYECLLRPLPEQAPFRPAELFDKARRIGQHSFLDRTARESAIRMSADLLPRGAKRFVNFLPSSLYCADNCLQGTFDAIEETGTDPEDIVFEVAETERLDQSGLDDIFDRYRRQGIRLAVDDVGSGYATLDAIDRLKPEYVKLDRKWVSLCDQDREKQKHIDGVLERVSRFYGIVLAEGVEREEEWHYLRRAGVPLLQGYLFGLAKPVPSPVTRTFSKI